MAILKQIQTIAACLIYLWVCSKLSAQEENTAMFQPLEDKTLLIVGQDCDTITDYIEATQHIPGGFMMYTSIQEMGGFDSRSRDHGSGYDHADALLNQYPHVTFQVGLYMVNALKDTSAGKYDANIEKLAQWLNKTRIPVYLRIGYEFDGAHNHYDPNDYIKAYRYIVDKLRSYEVSNVAYVWHSWANNTTNIEKWYPGDDYVDWVGISYFAQPEDFMEPVVQHAKSIDKPVMIAEATPKGTGTTLRDVSWEFWFDPFFRFIDRHQIPVVSYINSNWEAQPMWKGQGWEDARVQENQYMKERWLSKVHEEKYLHSSESLFRQLGYDKQ